MDYAKHYNSLIEKAQKRTLAGYSERHHIIPKCLGGGNESANLVRLTPEEHYMAHVLLVKINPKNNELVLAACIMAHSPHGKRHGNKLYGWLKRKLAVTQSQRFSGKTWTPEQNMARSSTVKAQWADPENRAKKIAGMVGKTWSAERRAAKSAALLGKPGRVWTAEQKAKLSATKRNQQLLKGAGNV